MAEEGKKISFSFAKSIKKPTLDKQVLAEKKKDYIKCLDEKAIKVIGEEEKKEEPLIIPLLKSKSLHDRIINKIDADVFKTKATNKDHTEIVKIKEEPKTVSNKDHSEIVKIKEEPKTVPNGDLTLINEAVSTIQIKTEPSNENETLTLDEQAAKEIIEDLKSVEKNEDKLSDLTLPVTERQNLMGAEEVSPASTLEDYEKIPLEAFGTAMLRGMGWKPGGGIGRNPKVVTPITPELRPVGMGLGADKLALQKQNGHVNKEEETLEIKKGSFIKIISGKRSNMYGQIEGFDDAGRLIVKMALNGNTISVNECIIQVVTAEDYSKNSKVLNAAKYEEHKNKESANKSVSPEHLNSNDDSDSDTHNRKKKHRENDSGHKSKKSRKKSKDQRDLSDSDSDTDSKRRNRKRRTSSSSDRTKKAKKSKKHKEKDKERERRKDKISRHSESSNRRKSKKHTRSRSSSRR